MLQWNDNARDYIERTRKARDYLARAEQKGKSDEKLFAVFIYIALALLITVILVMLPGAFDQMMYEQYDKPLELHKEMIKQP